MATQRQGTSFVSVPHTADCAEQRKETLICHERAVQHAWDWYMEAESKPAQLARLACMQEAITRLIVRLT